MNVTDLFALIPLIVIAVASIVVMLATAFFRNHRVAAGLTLLGLAIAFVTLPIVSAGASLPLQVTPLLTLDGYALFYMGLLFAASFAVTLLSYGYLERRTGNREAFYILLLIATLGSAVLVASSHFASFFLGLETLSVALYGLIAYRRIDEQSIEAGLKYLVLAAVSSAFLLFGMALVYAELGTMEFARMGEIQPTNALPLAGLALIIIGVGFKLGVVPFHMWTPDVYEGAPVPVTAFVATVSKGGMFALLMRYFVGANAYANRSMVLVFTLIAIASMIVGNLLALLQDNVKRIFAYSSIAHLGYLLVALVALRQNNPMAATAATYYLVAYFVTTLGAFGVMAVLSGPDSEADAIDHYRGLAWRRPWLAALFTGTLLSLAGIPLTAGFVGKFYVVAAGVGSALWLLVLFLVVNSAIGLFYYLRIVVAMYMQPSAEADERVVSTASSLSLTGGIALAGLTLLLVWLGVYPAPLLRVIASTVARLV